jgi:hypothetical protein
MTQVYAPECREGRHRIRELPGAVVALADVHPVVMAARAQQCTPYCRRPDQADLVCLFGHGPRRQLWFLHCIDRLEANRPEIQQDCTDQTHASGAVERTWFPRVMDRTFEHRGRFYRTFAKITVAGSR